MTLTEFLLARIAEDEAWARQAGDVLTTQWDILEQLRDPGPAEPARVLAEVEAKRRILELYDMSRDRGQGPGGYLEQALQALALPYADHPDFNPEWRP